MRRHLAIFLLAAFLLVPNLPAQAQPAPINADTTAAKGRIDEYVKYMTSTEQWKSIEDGPDNATIDLASGLYYYVEKWVDVFQHVKYSGLFASEYAVGFSGSTDATRGEGVGNWYAYCGKHKDFLLKTQELANRIMSAAGSKSATADMQTKLSEIMRSVAAIAQNSMTVDLAAAGSRVNYGNIVCAKALADITYSLKEVPAGVIPLCASTIIQSPSKDYTDGCPSGTLNSVTFPVGAMPSCTAGSIPCKATVTTQCKTACFWYDFKTSKANMDVNLKAYEDALAAEDKKLVEIAGALAKADADAAKNKADLQSRGTALSLPLPLSDITLEGAIGNALNALLGIVGAIALLMFVWGGIQWMTAAGNQEQVGKAKKTITWAALGLVAIFSSYAILSLVIQTFSTK